MHSLKIKMKNDKKKRCIYNIERFNIPNICNVPKY